MPIVVRPTRARQVTYLVLLGVQLPIWLVLGWGISSEHRVWGLAAGALVGVLVTRMAWPLAAAAFTTTTFTEEGIEQRAPGREPVVVTYRRLRGIGYRQHPRGGRYAVLTDASDRDRPIEVALELRGVHRPKATTWLPAVARELLARADARGVPVHPRSRHLLQRFASR